MLSANDGLARETVFLSPTWQKDGGSAESAHGQLQDRRTANALRRRNRELALLNQAAQALSSTLDLDQVLVTVMEEVRHLLGAVACSIWLTDRETGELVCRQAAGPRSEIVRGWRLPPGEGLVGWVVQAGQSHIAPDVRSDERHCQAVDQQTGLALRSILSVPLRVKGQAIGVLQVVDAQVGRFDAPEQALLESLAALAASAIDNARLVRELESHNAELDAFNHTLAHDLKNPLGVVIGFAEVLEQDHAALPAQEMQQYLHLIARNGRKIKSMIDELLLLAGARHMQEVQVQPLDMAHIVDQALERLSLMTEEHQVELVLPEAWPAALGYGPWIEEVWDNYISNAIKYGGRPARIELGSSSPSGGQVRFWVRDNGRGLTPEQQACLFAPFTQLNPGREGHGLGLSIVRRIVEKLGGEVGVEIAPGQGSVFSFTLPAMN